MPTLLHFLVHVHNKNSNFFLTNLAQGLGRRNFSVLLRTIFLMYLTPKKRRVLTVVHTFIDINIQPLLKQCKPNKLLFLINVTNKIVTLTND